MLPGFEELNKPKKVRGGGGCRSHALLHNHALLQARSNAVLDVRFGQPSGHLPPAHTAAPPHAAGLPPVQGGKRKAEEEAGATDGEGGAAPAKVGCSGFDLQASGLH